MNSKLLVCFLIGFGCAVLRAPVVSLPSPTILHFTPQDLDIADAYLQGAYQLFNRAKYLANPTTGPDRLALILYEKNTACFENLTSCEARYLSKSAKSFFKYKNKLKKFRCHPDTGLSCQYVIGCAKSQKEHVLPAPIRKQDFKSINTVTT